MWQYVVLIIVFIFLGFWIRVGIRMKQRHEVYMASGAGFAALLLLVRFIPYSSAKWIHAIGMIIAVSGGVLAFGTMVLMRLQGKPTSGWEHTTELIQTSVFRFVRHPIYLASALAVFGFAMWFPYLSTTLFCLPALFCFFNAARWEDNWNLEKFGEPYKKYREKTRLFIPFVY